MQLFALRVEEPINCQHKEEKCSYRRFVKIVIGIMIIAVLLILFRKIGVLMLVFVLHVIGFHVIICVAVLYMN